MDYKSYIANLLSDTFDRVVRLSNGDVEIITPNNQKLLFPFPNLFNDLEINKEYYIKDLERY